MSMAIMYAKRCGEVVYYVYKFKKPYFGVSVTHRNGDTAIISDFSPPEHRPCKSRRNPGRPDPAGRRRGLCQKPGAESGDHPAGQRDRCAGVSGAVGHLPEIRDRTDAGCSGGSAAGGNPCYNSGGGYDRLPVCPGA